MACIPPIHLQPKLSAAMPAKGGEPAAESSKITDLFKFTRRVGDGKEIESRPIDGARLGGTGKGGEVVAAKVKNLFKYAAVVKEGFNLEKVNALIKDITSNPSFFQKAIVEKFAGLVEGFLWTEIEILAPHVPIPLLEGYMATLPASKQQDPHIRGPEENRNSRLIMKGIVHKIRSDQTTEALKKKTIKDLEEMPDGELENHLNQLPVSEIAPFVAKIPEDKFTRYALKQSPDKYRDEANKTTSRRTALLNLLIPEEDKIEAEDAVKTLTNLKRFASYEELLSSKSSFGVVQFAKVFQKTTKLPESAVFKSKTTNYGASLFESCLRDILSSNALSSDQPLTAAEFLMIFKSYMHFQNDKSEIFSLVEFGELLEVNRNLSEDTKRFLGADRGYDKLAAQYESSQWKSGQKRILKQVYYDDEQVAIFDAKIDDLIKAVLDPEIPSLFSAVLSHVLNQPPSAGKRAVSAPKADNLQLSKKAKTK